MVLARALLAAVALLVLAAPPALAHAGDDRGPSNHRITLDDVPDGVEARLVEAETRVELTYRGDGEVVVLGYDGEPYLRLGPDGAEENRRSPAAYLNTTYDGGSVPPGADSEADPDWVAVSDDPTVRWHDHRFHPPPSPPADPDRRQVVTPWEVPLVVDGEQAALTGVIEWVPPPPVWPWWLLAAVLAIVVIASCHRRRRLAAPAVTRALWVALGAAVVADVVRAAGIVGEVGGGVGTFVEVVRLSALGWILAIVAAVLAKRGRRNDALVAAAVAGAAIALGAGVLELGDIGSSQLATALPDLLARAVVAVALGTGAGAAVAGARFLLSPGTR